MIYWIQKTLVVQKEFLRRSALRSGVARSALDGGSFSWLLHRENNS